MQRTESTDEAAPDIAQAQSVSVKDTDVMDEGGAETSAAQMVAVDEAPEETTDAMQAQLMPVGPVDEEADADAMPPDDALQTNTVQMKVAVGAPNDRFEQEADNVADQVMRMPVGGSDTVQRAPLAASVSAVKGDDLQRACADCEAEALQTSVDLPTIPEGGAAAPEGAEAAAAETAEEPEGGEFEESADVGEGGAEPVALPALPEMAAEPEAPALQTKASGVSAVDAGVETSLRSSRGNGKPLGSAARQQMEPRFGADFSDVHVHTDASAVQMNRDLNARAFTHGKDIYFDSGEYRPDSASGQRLLAHELTHTIQQGGGGDRIQRLDRAEQTVTLEPAAERNNDGQEVTGRMNQRIDDDPNVQEGADLSEEERRERQNPDRGEVRQESNELEQSGESSPAVDRAGPAREQAEEQRAEIDQQLEEQPPEAEESEGEEGEAEEAELSEAEASAGRAVQAEQQAQAVVIPAEPQAFRQPELRTPVDSAGEDLPRQGAMDTRVRGLGYIGGMLRHKGYEMKRYAAEQEIGAWGNEAVLERSREDLANAREGTTTMQTHNEERRQLVERSRGALQESVERQQFVAEEAPDLAGRASEKQAEAGELERESSEKAERAQSEQPDDPDARRDAEEQSADMQESSEGAASMNQAVTQTADRANQYMRDANQAAEQNQQSETQINDTEATIGELDGRLEEMSASNDASQEQIDNVAEGPARIRQFAERNARTGDELIAATIVMEEELNALQQDYLNEMAAIESREDAEERLRQEREQEAEPPPSYSPEEQRLFELNAMSEEEQEETIADMDQGERDALMIALDNMIRQAPESATDESEGRRTQVNLSGAYQELQGRAATAAFSHAANQATLGLISDESAQAAGQWAAEATGMAQAPPDPRAEQIQQVDDRRAQRVGNVMGVADQNMNHLTQAEQMMLSDRLVAQSITDDIANINVLQMGKHMLLGLVNPFISLQGVVGGFDKLLTGFANIGNMEAWRRDPLGNLLQVAADISTGMAMIFSGVLGIAAAITALMVILTIVSWGTLSPITGPVIGWMGTVMTYAGWGAVISGALAVLFNYLAYIKNLHDAGTAETASEMFANTDQMRQNANDGFAGAMAVVEGVGAVKMGPLQRSGEFFRRVPRSPGAAASMVRQGVGRVTTGAAGLSRRAWQGAGDLFASGVSGMRAFKARLRGMFGRRGTPDVPHARTGGVDVDVPSTRRGAQGTPEASGVRTARDADLGSFEGRSVRAEVDLPGGRRMQVLDDGTCLVCTSPCRPIRQNFLRELDENPRIRMRLDRIERSLARNPNQPRVLAAQRQILDNLGEIRARRPTDIASRYRAELELNPRLADELTDLTRRVRAKPLNRRLQRRFDSLERRLAGVGEARVARPGDLSTRYGPELRRTSGLAEELNSLARQIERHPFNQRLQRRLNALERRLVEARARVPPGLDPVRFYAYVDDFAELASARSYRGFKNRLQLDGLTPAQITDVVHQGSLRRGSNLWGDNWKRYYEEISGTDFPGEPFHAHHLAEKGSDSAAAIRNRQLLQEVGLNPRLARENLAWARNIAGQHGGGPQQVLLNMLIPVRGNRPAIISALARYAEIAAAR